MRVSSINSNINFGRVTRKAAEHALEKSRKEQTLFDETQTKTLILKGYSATNYDVDYNEKTGKYFIYRNNEEPKKVTILPEKFQAETTSFANAIDFSLKQQSMHNACVNELVKTADTEDVLKLFTVKK